MDCEKYCEGNKEETMTENNAEGSTYIGCSGRASMKIYLRMRR